MATQKELLDELVKTAKDLAPAGDQVKKLTARIEEKKRAESAVSTAKQQSPA